MRILSFSEIIGFVGQFLLDFLFPKECCGCRKVGCYLCLTCLERIPLVDTPTCPRCRSQSIAGRVCPSCQRFLSFDSLVIATEYSKDAIFTHALHLYKYHFCREIGHLLTTILIRQWERIGTRCGSHALVVPIPLHPRRLRFRGFNQSAILAETFAQHFEIPLLLILKRTRYTKPQVQLSREERLQNVRDAFRISHGENLVGKTIILIDDVCTTLSTLEECSKVLKSAGASVVHAVVLGRGVM